MSRIGLVVAACLCTCTPADDPAVPAPVPTPIDAPVDPLPPAAVVEAAPATSTTSPSPSPSPSVELPPVAMTTIPRGKLKRSDRHTSYDKKSVVVQSFAIDDVPVSRARYASCVAAGACPTPRSGECQVNAGADDPMTCVDLFEAQTYCAWVGKELPNEDQWELAAKVWSSTADTLAQWVRTTPCPPWARECRGRADWTIDGMREVMVTAIPGGLSIPHPEPHERASNLGFRCARTLTKPSPKKPHAGACWASCDGCDGPLDGEVDRRVIAPHALPGETPTTAATSSARDPDGRVIATHTGTGASETKDFYRYGPLGNVVTRLHTGADGAQFWQYHDECRWPSSCPRAKTTGALAPNAEFGRCVASAGGTWDLRFVDVARTECESGGEDCERMVAGKWALRYTARTGEQGESALAEFAIGEIDAFERRPLVAFDWDGDGHAELAVRDLEGAWEDAGPQISVWTFQQGRVVPYLPVSHIADIEAFDDIDHDRRPDIRAPGGLAVPPSFVMGDDCDGGVTSVFRSNEDGTFTQNPPATRADLQAQCPLETTLFGRKPAADGKGFQRIACLFLRGAGKEELQSRIAAEFPRVSCDGDDFCPCTREDYEKFVRELPSSATGLLAGP